MVELIMGGSFEDSAVAESPFAELSMSRMGFASLSALARAVLVRLPSHPH